MSYRKIRKACSLGGQIEPRKRHRMAAIVPSKQEIVAGIRRAIKRAEQWKRSASTTGSPPRHIAEKLQATARLTVAP